MTLPESFHFTQSSLQDYLDCARRFRRDRGRTWQACRRAASRLRGRGAPSAQADGQPKSLP
jgi:hypothetical protein